MITSILCYVPPSVELLGLTTHTQNSNQIDDAARDIDKKTLIPVGRIHVILDVQLCYH